jgi:uncharacterized Zn finger protein
MKCPSCGKEIEVIQEKHREVAYCDCGKPIQPRAVWEYTPAKVHAGHTPAPVTEAKEPVVKKEGDK